MKVNQYEWTEVKYRSMTEEEIAKYEQYWGIIASEDEKKVFDCEMPNDNDEILVATQYGVSQDTCCYDPDEGYGLEERGDWEGVLAWMPLPTYEGGRQ